MQGGERYNSINDYLKSVFGRKTVKLSIDAGFTCPNRDGSKGLGGCTFCSEGGSGEFASPIEYYPNILTNNLGSIGSTITAQIERLSLKWPDAAYLAYFQSFTNTYAPVERLRTLYYEALNDPHINGLAIATRPDCLSPDVLDLLSEINRNNFLWVEIGLQTIHSETQKNMNLCYDTKDYDYAMYELSSRGIKVVTHLILGLPGESEDMMMESLRYVCHSDDSMDGRKSNRAPFGIKLHLMNLIRTSELYKKQPDYVPFSTMEEYVDLVVRCLEIIPYNITIHRLTGDVPRKILVAPEWSYRKRSILNAINKELALRDTCQGARVGMK